MTIVSEKHLDAFVTTCHRVASHGLARSSSGNMSWRIEGERLLITTTKSWMASLTREQIAVCRISDGAVLNEKKPSAENGFHFGILRQRPDVNVVLHFQSPYATAISCSDREHTNFCVIPEVPYYVGQVATIPYLNPGSDELARAVISAMKEHNLVIMKNHGQVTVGKNFDEAIQRAVFFELACEIIIHAGGRVHYISQDGIDYLRQRY